MAESFKADGHDHPKDLRSLYQPHSLNHTPNNSYSSLNYPSKSHPSQLHADNEAVTLPSQKTNTPHDTSSHLQRIPKSQSFSQVGHVMQSYVCFYGSNIGLEWVVMCMIMYSVVFICWHILATTLPMRRLKGINIKDTQPYELYTLIFCFSCTVLLPFFLQ